MNSVDVDWLMAYVLCSAFMFRLVFKRSSEHLPWFCFWSPAKAWISLSLTSHPSKPHIRLARAPLFARQLGLLPKSEAKASSSIQPRIMEFTQDVDTFIAPHR